MAGSAGRGSPRFLGLRGLLRLLWCALIGSHPDLRPLTISPLVSLVTVPFVALFPGLYALLLVRSAEQRRGLLGFSFNDRIHAFARELLAAQALWWLFLYGLGLIIDHRTQIIVATFERKARAHQVLQLATPEQLELNHSMMVLLGLCAAAFLLGLYLMLSYFMHLSTRGGSPLRFALRSLLSNLPLIALIAGLTVLTLIIIERHYAHFRLQAFEAYVMGQEAFDPTMPFLLIRLLCLNAFLVWLILAAALAAGVVRLR